MSWESNKSQLDILTGHIAFEVTNKRGISVASIKKQVASLKCTFALIQTEQVSGFPTLESLHQEKL